jgi:opacity protein-like surface antigen
MTRSFVRTTVAAAAVAVAMGSAPAMAVDLLIPVDNGGGYVWDGFYAGVLGGFWSGNNAYLLGGGTLGANFSLGNNLVAGVEGRGVIYSDGDLGFDGTGRLGMTFDQVLVYGDAGVGIRDGAGHFFVGAGAEVAVMDNLTLDGRAEFVTGTGFNAFRATGALNFHF